MAHKIWRDDEGTPWQATEGSTATESAESEIWRSEEGAPWTDGSSTRTRRRKAQRPRRPRSIPSPRARDEKKARLRPVITRWRHRHLRRTRARHQGRSRTRRILLAGALVAFGLLLLGADALYVGLGLARELPRAGAALEMGADRFGSGKIDEARAELQNAAASARGALARMGHPSFALAARLPWLRDDAQAIRVLARAAELSSRAGLKATAVASTLGWAEDGLAPAIYADGQVDLAAIADAQPQVMDASELLVEAEEILRRAPPPDIDVVANALNEGLARIRDAAATADKGAALFEALPGLLGADGERRYLLAFQALGEARATGGIVGLYGVLEAENGRLELTRIGPHTDLKIKEVSSNFVPPWFDRAYSPQLALKQWLQANVSPNFPVVGDVLGEMFESATSEKIDGVVAMDPVTMEHLMGAMGAITHENRVITSENVVEVLLEESYLDFPDQDSQNRFLAGVVRAFWRNIKVGDFRPRTFAAGLSEAIRTGHLKFAMEDDELQSDFRRMEATGDYTAFADNVQMVFHNNYTASKVDYYMRRRIDTEIEITAKGQALVRTTVMVRNNAPVGPSSLLLGPGVEGDPPGLNRMLLNVLLPVDAEVTEVTVNNRPSSVALTYNDQEHTVVWDILAIPAGEDAHMTVRYHIPLNELYFSFTLFPQSLTSPDQFSMSIKGSNNDVNTQGVLDEPQTFTAEVTGI